MQRQTGSFLDNIKSRKLVQEHIPLMIAWQKTTLGISESGQMSRTIIDK